MIKIFTVVAIITKVFNAEKKKRITNNTKKEDFIDE
jgi:hypothetical protein